MHIRSIVLPTALILSLAACGGDDDAKVDTPASYADAYEKVGEDAKDVKIKDKVTLTPAARFANVYINEMDATATALENVNDKASAEKAARVIRGMNEKIEEMADKMDDGVVMEQRMAMVMVSRQSEMMAVQQRMTAQMMRLQTQHPELMQIISDEMGRLGN